MNYLPGRENLSELIGELGSSAVILSISPIGYRAEFGRTLQSCSVTQQAALQSPICVELQIKSRLVYIMKRV